MGLVKIGGSCLVRIEDVVEVITTHEDKGKWRTEVFFRGGSGNGLGLVWTSPTEAAATAIREELLEADKPQGAPDA